MLWAAHRVDGLAVYQQFQTVHQEVGQIVGKTPYDQQSVTIWDDAVAYTTRSFDPVWIDENLGVWMHDYFGHDRVTVLDSADVVIYSYPEGHAELPPLSEAFGRRSSLSCVRFART